MASRADFSGPLEQIDKPIIAWRAWQLQYLQEGKRYTDPVLCPTGLSLARIEETPWTPLQKGKAVHWGGGDPFLHAYGIPEANCTCGFWAYNHPQNLAEGHGLTSFVIGRVNMWGKIVVGTAGYRAEFVYPDQLWVPDHLQEIWGKTILAQDHWIRENSLGSMAVDLLAKTLPSRNVAQDLARKYAVEAWPLGSAQEWLDKETLVAEKLKLAAA